MAYQVSPGHGLTVKVRHILEKHKNSIWNVFQDDSVCPDFTKEPVLNPISIHDAAFHLVGEFKNDVFFNRAGENSPARLLMRLCMILEGVPCYRLSAGRLETMKMLLSESARLHIQ